MFTGRWWVIEEDAAGGRASSAMKGCSNEVWLHHRLILCVLRWEDDPRAADLEFAAVMISFGISTLMARKCCRRSSGRVVALLLMLQGGARDSGDPAGHGSLCRLRLSSFLSPCRARTLTVVDLTLQLFSVIQCCRHL
jgi:hypothetical protein